MIKIMTEILRCEISSNARLLHKTLLKIRMWKQITVALQMMYF
jgi:hypothetical protein